LWVAATSEGVVFIGELREERGEPRRVRGVEVEIAGRGGRRDEARAVSQKDAAELDVVAVAELDAGDALSVDRRAVSRARVFEDPGVAPPDKAALRLRDRRARQAQVELACSPLQAARCGPLRAAPDLHDVEIREAIPRAAERRTVAMQDDEEEGARRRKAHPLFGGGVLGRAQGDRLPRHGRTVS
jgi:hypothetical protein